MRLIVLGAGASFGASDYKVAPAPLVDQFFETAAQHGLLAPGFGTDSMQELRRLIKDLGGNWGAVEASVGGPLQGHLAVLKAFVEEQLGVPQDELATRPVDIERLFGLVEAELLGRVGFDRLKDVPSRRSPADVLEQQLFLIICGTLIASTDGVECIHHRALAEWLEPGDAVMSFNYDLLMDRALAARGDWWINDGYGLDFHRVGRRPTDRSDWRVPLHTESTIRLLKPHGSLNWLHCRDPAETLNHISLRGGIPTTPPNVLYCLEDMHPDFPADFPLFEWWARYEHDGPDDHAFDLHSLIVPPASTKNYRDLEPLIGGIWATALDTLLSDAKELYFVGYSLRPEDLRSWWLFRKAAVEAEQLERVIVIDPSDPVVSRMKDVFSDSVVERPTTTFAEFAGAL